MKIWPLILSNLILSNSTCVHWTEETTAMVKLFVDMVLEFVMASANSVLYIV